MSNCKEEHPKKAYKKPRYTLAEVFGLYFEGYSQRHKVSSREKMIVERIMACGTGALGAHVKRCDHCGQEELVPDSCRDRHCPSCQYKQKEEWLIGRVSSLLPVVYHHVVFTLPHQLNGLMKQNKKVMYDLFMDATAETLHEFGKDKARLGVTLGFTSVLHTWNLKQEYHVHSHHLVTAGGLSLDGKQWIEPKYAKKFLFPVRAISKVMRGKYIGKLRAAYKAGVLKFWGAHADLAKQPYFEMFVDDLSRKIFRIHLEPILESPEKVVAYFGSYTHRVALTNYSLKSITGGFVTFSYKDRENKGQQKTLTLRADPFIGRFLHHILPKGFHKIRHYGLNSSAALKTKVPLVWKLLAQKVDLTPIVIRLVDKVEAMERALQDLLKCKRCGRGQMRFVGLVPYVALLASASKLLFGHGL